MSEFDNSLPASRTFSSKIGQFFSSHARLSLFVLMLFAGLVVALAPIAWTYWPVSKPVSAGAGSATRGGALNAKGNDARCNQILVSFVSTATVAQISKLLESLNATIGFGPNENGIYELRVASNTALAVVQALNRAEELVVVAEVRESCL
jgi:hypothetical protein